MDSERVKLFNKQKIDSMINRMATEIIQNNEEYNHVILVGIQTRGVPLAERIRKIIEEKTDSRIAKGELDIKLYQSNLHAIGEKPIVGRMSIQGNISNKKIILIDDVLYTGRTIIAAIMKLLSSGMPDIVKLAILIDRGWHRFPITPDYIGKRIETEQDDEIQVRFQEIDDEEGIFKRKINR